MRQQHHYDGGLLVAASCCDMQHEPDARCHQQKGTTMHVLENHMHSVPHMVCSRCNLVRHSEHWMQGACSAITVCTMQVGDVAARSRPRSAFAEQCRDMRVTANGGSLHDCSRSAVDKIDLFWRLPRQGLPPHRLCLTAASCLPSSRRCVLACSMIDLQLHAECTTNLPWHHATSAEDDDKHTP